MKSAFDPSIAQWRIDWPGRVSRHDIVFLTPPDDPLHGLAGAALNTCGSRIAQHAPAAPLTGLTVLDVRTADEFAAADGHALPGAVNIPIEELRGRLDELPAGDLVVVCAKGPRSVEAARLIAAAERGDMDAQYAAGLVYAEGRGVPQDAVQSYYWLTRAVELTEAGRALAPGAADGFATLSAAWRAARRVGDARGLTVTAGPAFTAKWLAPRIFEFAQAHPEIDLRFAASLRKCGDGVGFDGRASRRSWCSWSASSTGTATPHGPSHARPSGSAATSTASCSTACSSRTRPRS